MAKSNKNFITCDGNTAAANIAYEFSDVASIYPITPASSMGEMVDEWSAEGRKNLFGESLKVVEMQSEAGAAGTIHGSLSTGALTTTFTASQGLMLMLPNMFKIAGELLPTVFHVSARSLACQSLSIFGDHSDVMAVRGTGFALMAAADAQEVQDLGAISHLSTLESSIPFLNFFDGFRTSHEIQKIETIDQSTLNSLLKNKYVQEFKDRALTPNDPKSRVGTENPTVYFQGRETVNKYYNNTPKIVKKYMKEFWKKTGRKYDIFEYVGDPKAKKVIVSMGSSVDTIQETVEHLNKRGEKVGLVKVRLYRPFSVEDFKSKVPSTTKKIAVLDRTKEPGAVGEPLYLDVSDSLKDSNIKIIGGRYGLSSKEFTPSMVKAVFDHLDDKSFHGFTVGIEDDVTNTSIPVKEEVNTEPDNVVRCKFWGFGSDGTVSANKNSIKIIGESTNQDVQAYFSYDAKKSGGVTVSHLRFGKDKIRSHYLLTQSDFIALHKDSYIGKYDILKGLRKGGTFLINTDIPPEKVFENLTKKMQDKIVRDNIKVYAIDASKIASEAGLKGKINTAMQAAFFKLSGVIPKKEAIKLMKEHVEKQFRRKGKEIVEMNFRCIDNAVDAIKEVPVKKTSVHAKEKKMVPSNASRFEKNVIAPCMRKEGDSIPVSCMPNDGAVPTGTASLEKRGISEIVPEWIPDKCIQCGLCSMACPHSAIRTKQIHPNDLKKAPDTFETIKSNTKNDKNLHYKVQPYPEDCVGCRLCEKICPVKAIQMKNIDESRKKGENENQEFFDSVKGYTDGTSKETVKGSQLRDEYFEFSGACAGCGETPYIKLATQLFGERMVIANATGCSSVYGGTFPTIPYTKDSEGRGPAWANSLFEDNGEFGFGMKMGIDSNRELLKKHIENYLKKNKSSKLSKELKYVLDNWDDYNEELYEKVKWIKKELSKKNSKDEGLEKIKKLRDYLLNKSVWIIGGDGWAYDIGFGGLDHVMAQGKNVNILVLDSEVYSNTGGQTSKATPRGATAKFSFSGKETPKKNLGRMAMTYENVYVASISLGANQAQAVKAFNEAEKFPGTSIIIAYSPCIAHGFDMSNSQKHEKDAVFSGYWPLYRYNPLLLEKGKDPFMWDSPKPMKDFNEFINEEKRYSSLKIDFPEKAQKLFKLAKDDADERTNMLKKIKEDMKDGKNNS